MENKEPQKELSYKELERVAQQLADQVNQWKQKAYEEAGKNNRISLILEILKLELESRKGKNALFNLDQVLTMSNELYNALYSKEEVVTPTDGTINKE